MASKSVRAKKCMFRSQMATAAPPLGPMLGKRGVNVAEFCKDFNKRTHDIKAGIPLPTSITVRPDRTYELDISTPQNEWLLKQAAGIGRSKEERDEVVGWLSVKHIYEIAKIKSKDRFLVGVPLEDICDMLIKSSHEIGIKIQHSDLDANKYREFLDERRPIVAEQLKKIEEDQTSKILRT